MQERTKIVILGVFVILLFGANFVSFWAGFKSGENHAYEEIEKQLNEAAKTFDNALRKELGEQKYSEIMQ